MIGAAGFLNLWGGSRWDLSAEPNLPLA